MKEPQPTMQKDEVQMIAQKVQEIIVDIGCMKPIETITMEDSLEHDLGVDSLMAIEFLVALEETFDITILDSDILQREQWMSTIGTIVDFIEGRTSEKAHVE